MANNQYLTFIALEDCEFSVRVWSGYPHMSRYYSVDNGNSWVSLSSSSEKAPLVTTPTITSGNTILWRGETNSSYAGEFGIFSSTGRFIAEGNALSIDNFLNFSGCTNLVSAENITFTNGVYKGYTFEGCTSLVTPPPSVPDGGVGVFSGCTSMTSLPTIQNTTLDFECFKYMFKGCSSLTTIPSNYLPSQIMAMRCYVGMFEDCTSLVNVPSDLLQAPVLTDGCYEEMFKGCTSLRIAPNLNYGESLIYPNTDTSIYKSMFENCTSLEKIPILNEKIDGTYNYQYTFKGCTSLDHATVNAKGGQGMFSGCTSLSAVTCLDETPSYQQTYQWLSNVQYDGIFFYADSASWSRDANGIPSSWRAVPYGQNVYEKYLVYKKQYSIDEGSTWIDTNPLETYTDDEPIETYPTSEECMAETARWIPSGYTCINGDKYQNNYKQISYDGEHWHDSDPLEWSASTIIESASTDCISYRWTQSGTTCVGVDKYQNNIKEKTVDGGVSWSVVIPEEYSASTLIQAKSTDCGFSARTISTATTCVNFDKHYLDEYQESTDYGRTWTTVSTSTGSLIKANSIACGYVPPATTSDYLTFYVGEDTTFGWEDYVSNNSVQYSLDSGSTWHTLNSEGVTPTVQAEHKIMFKGNATMPDVSIGYGIGGFSSRGMCVVVGNPMSLIHGDNFASHTSLDNNDAVFSGLFSGCEKLTNARNLFLTPTALTFCCYSDMFEGCSYLTEGPVLSAATLAHECYSYMFRNCSSLNKVTCLATDISASRCIYAWLDGVASSGTFYKASTATKWQEGVSGIPSGWTVVDIT